MEEANKADLEARGWHGGSAAEFLKLSLEEAARVETNLAASERRPS